MSSGVKTLSRSPTRNIAPAPIGLGSAVTRAFLDDDYGVKDLELVYSVNGGAETIRLALAGLEVFLPV